MAVWKMSKLRGGRLEIITSPVEFDDTFPSVHLREYYIEKFGLKPPCMVEKAENPTLYKTLCDFITEINLFKPRDEVPNKTVTTDVWGTSKLIRSKDKSRIEICYRVINKKGELEKRAKSNNTCYITLAEREEFFSDSKAAGCPHRDSFGHDHYFLKVEDRQFKWWSDFMDKEYARLAGDKYLPKEKPIFSQTDQEKDEVAKCLWYYAETKPGTDMGIIETMANRGLCKLNDKKTALYDKEGIWICQLDEFLERDSGAYMMLHILQKLNWGELMRAKYTLLKDTPHYSV